MGVVYLCDDAPFVCQLHGSQVARFGDLQLRETEPIPSQTSRDGSFLQPQGGQQMGVCHCREILYR